MPRNIVAMDLNDLRVCTALSNAGWSQEDVCKFINTLSLDRHIRNMADTVAHLASDHQSLIAARLAVALIEACNPINEELGRAYAVAGVEWGNDPKEAAAANAKNLIDAKVLVERLEAGQSPATSSRVQ